MMSFTPDKYDRIDIILGKSSKLYSKNTFSDEEQYMESINYKRRYLHRKFNIRNLYINLMNLWNIHNDEVEDQDEQIMEF